MKSRDSFTSLALALSFLAVLSAGLLCASTASAASTGKIVYYTNVPDNGSSVHYQIYIVNGDGTGNTRLNRASDDLTPALSPDGTQIAFTSSLGSGLFLMNADGTGAAAIPNAAGCKRPAWSADGSKLAAIQSGTFDTIVTFNPDGSELHQVTVPGYPTPYEAAWSPDGTKLVFWGYDRALFGTQIYIVNVDGASAPVRLSKNDNSAYRQPSWSPDGTKIACQINGAIYLLDPSTGAETRVTPPDVDISVGDESPTFSPDGTQLAFQSSEDSGLGVMNLDGSNRHLLNTPRANDPKWSRAAPPAGPTPPPHGGLSTTTFAVNETTTAAANLADTVLRFRAVQVGTPAKLIVHVQANSGSGWADLADGLSGRMSYAPQVTSFILNSTNYPTVNGISFRAVSSAPGYPDSISNVVGPFNLQSSTTHLGPTKLFVSTNGEINSIRFGVNEATVPAGVSVRVQTTQTPAVEASWTNAPIGNGGLMTQDSADTKQFYLGSDNYSEGEGNYFRAVATSAGSIASYSISYGPFKFVNDPAATVTIQVNGVTVAPNDIDSDQLLPLGTFNMSAIASSGRFLKRLTLLYDGNVLAHFDDGATSGALDYTTNIPGDHLIEAYATDDLGVTGAAAPIHVRILQAAPGKTYKMTASGNWNNAANWADSQGNHAVPGPNDFAIVSTFSPTLSTDVTVNAMSLNGGTLDGTKTLTVTGFCTIADGAIKANLTIPAGATAECLNDSDIILTGKLTYAGTMRVHGKGGIGGMHTAAGRMNSAGVQTDGLFDFVGGIINGVGRFISDLASGGRRGSKAMPATPATIAPEVRTIAAATINISGGTVTAVSAPANLISQDGGGLISQDGGGLISQDGGGLVASGAGNLVASGAGNLVASGAGNLISQDGGGLKATGGSMLVASGAGNLVASGAGNLVASGAGNRPTSGPSLATASSADAISLDGGVLDLSGFTIFGNATLNGGVLSGSGVILGDLTNNSGYISPGHSAGILAVTGSFSQGPSGTLVVEDGGATPDQFDQLLIGGVANLGGKLIVHMINGYAPDPADTFSPLGYGSVTGSFASISANTSLTFTENGALATTNPAIASPIDAALRNISTRARIGTGGNVLIGGFIVTGPSGATKKVMVRGLGPSLAAAGLTGLLSDPLLELHKPDGSTLTNDNWADLPNKSEIPNGFAPQAKESVIIADLGPGNYTVIERGAHGETGVGLAEIYDLNESSLAHLGNIATRAFVDITDNVLIGGFIVGGTEPGSILVRAVGPSLTGAGVPNALADPILELHDANGSVFVNDDWRETQETEIVATTIPPSDSREPAILATLVPGNYTIIVRGKDNTTGVGLVEAYNVK